LSQADDESTIFYLGSHGAPQLSALHNLKWAKDPDLFVTSFRPRQPCMLLRMGSPFRMNAVKADPWFVANFDYVPNSDPWVLHLAGSNIRDETPILLWPGNGGDNQIWRIEPVKS